MPTYQYSCTECGHFLEAVQKFTDDALTTCPECGGRLRKVFNAVGVVFKGSGFYRTDSRSAGKDAKDSAGKDSAGKDSAGKDSAGKDSEKKSGSADKSSSSEGSGSSKKEPAGTSSSSSSSSTSSD